MYLRSTGDSRTILYLEQRKGKQLTILDVAKLKSPSSVVEVSLQLPCAYDFVLDSEDSGVLIRYRNGSGYSIIGLRHYKHPVLDSVTHFPQSTLPEAYGQTAMLLRAPERSNAPLRAAAPEVNFKVIDTSDPTKPKTLATIHGIKQQLERQATRTLFLLNASGLTLVRRLRLEQESRHASNYVRHWEAARPPALPSHAVNLNAISS